MDNINYQNFENICRTCLLTCDNKLLQDLVISDIYYKLTDARWDLNDGLPQQICLKCYEKIIETRAFSLQCKQAHSSLMKCLFEFKNLQIKKEEPNIYESIEYVGIKDEIIIEEHKIEFIKEEENDINMLQIKQEVTEETIDELKLVPETDEINNDQNIISFQNYCNENVGNAKTLDDDTNQNDLNDDTNLDSTSIREVSNEISVYKCDLCPETFEFKWFLNAHKRKHSDKRPLLCTICNKTFITSSDLNTHKREHGDERPYECEICNKTFIQLNNLKSHKLVHSGERPYECDICNKSFNHVSNFKVHKRIHSGERPYECEICHNTFKQSSKLKLHKRIHSGERPYECEICHKTFNRSDHLKEHKRIHSGERPHECEICNKTFTDLYSLNRHKRIHNKKHNINNKSLESASGSKTQETVNNIELPYKCDICPKSFKRLSLLQGHKKTHSPNLNDSDDNNNNNSLC